MRYRYTAVIISSFAFFVGINLHSGIKKTAFYTQPCEAHTKTSSSHSMSAATGGQFIDHPPGVNDEKRRKNELSPVMKSGQTGNAVISPAGASNKTGRRIKYKKNLAQPPKNLDGTVHI